MTQHTPTATNTKTIAFAPDYSATTTIKVDPTTVVIDENVRTNAVPPRSLVESVTALGVIAPVLASLDADGTVRVRDGQLRTLAAREAGLASILAYIKPVDADLTDEERNIERIVEQLVANDQRTDLSRSDRTRAVEQLHLAGMPTREIAKKLSVPRNDIDHSLTAAKSTKTLDILDTTPDLTLDQASVLVQWEDDTEAVDKLLSSLTDGKFEHTAANLDSNRENRAAMRAEGDALAADGWNWTMNEPRYGTWTRLTSAYDTETREQRTHDQFAAADVLAYLRADESSHWEDSHGDWIDEDFIDWDLQDEPDSVLGTDDELVDPRTLTCVTDRTVEVIWFIHDDARRREGLVYHYELPRQVAETAPVDQEAAKEAEREQRRRVIALNKQADAAREVRLNAVKTWLTRKTIPTEHRTAIAAFIRDTLWTRHELLGTAREAANSKEFTAAMLGTKTVKVDSSTPATSADKIQLTNLAIALGAHEATVDRSAWRGHYNRAAIATYLQFLADVTSYTLSPVEEAMAGNLNADTIDID